MKLSNTIRKIVASAMILSGVAMIHAAQPKDLKAEYRLLTHQRDSVINCRDSMVRANAHLDSLIAGQIKLPVTEATQKYREEYAALQTQEKILQEKRRQRTQWMDRYLPEYLPEFESIVGKPLTALSEEEISATVVNLTPFAENERAAALLEQARHRRDQLVSLTYLRKAVDSPLTKDDLKLANDTYKNLHAALTPAERTALDLEIGEPLGLYAEATAGLKKIAADFRGIDKVRLFTDNPGTAGSVVWQANRDILLDKYFKPLLAENASLISTINKLPYTARLLQSYRQAITRNPMEVSAVENEIISIP
ncbi:MAG: hypothetical protein NC328_02050 [Muribaculum sp.]|nr:hypothetical protein [Muribaculum sp.]